MSELLLYSCVGSGVSVCTETIFISAHEEEISAELQYLDCLIAGGVHRFLLTDLSLVLYFVRVLLTTCIMRQYLQHNQVTQIVQLLQDGTSVCAVVRRFGASPSTVSRTWRKY